MGGKVEQALRHKLWATDVIIFPSCWFRPLRAGGHAAAVAQGLPVAEAGATTDAALENEDLAILLELLASLKWSRATISAMQLCTVQQLGG